MKRVLVFSFLACVMFAVSVGGCRESKPVIVSTTVERPQQARCQGKGILGDCVVTFFAEDGSRYLSEQQHQICPASGRVVMFANEPEGQFMWELSGGTFRTVKSAAKPADLPAAAWDRAMAKVILTSVTAGLGVPAEVLEVSSEQSKIDGRWYRVVEIGQGSIYSSLLGNIEVPWAKIILYVDTDKKVVDRVAVYDVEKELTLTALSYNFRRLEGMGETIPTKIDVFKSADKGPTLGRQLLEVDYYAIDEF